MHYKIKVQSPLEDLPETFETDTDPDTAMQITEDYHNAGYMILSVEVTPSEPH